MSIRLIAARLGRSPSTVSRELSRNTAPWDRTYEPVIAHLRVHERARRPKPGKVVSNQWLQRFVQVKLDELWSPEQMSLHLLQRFPDQPKRKSLSCDDPPSALPTRRRNSSCIDSPITCRPAATLPSASSGPADHLFHCCDALSTRSPH